MTISAEGRLACLPIAVPVGGDRPRLTRDGGSPRGQLGDRRPAIVDGTLYWGAGHTHLGLPMFTGNNKLYAFTLNGK